MLSFTTAPEIPKTPNAKFGLTLLPLSYIIQAMEELKLVLITDGEVAASFINTSLQETRRLKELIAAQRNPNIMVSLVEDKSRFTRVADLIQGPAAAIGAIVHGFFAS